MDIAKKIAKKHWNEVAVLSTASVSRHGLTPTARRIKRKANKAARREANKIALRD